MKNKFIKTYNLIMESIDTEWSELYNKIKNNSDVDMLNDWVEEIDAQFNAWIDEADGHPESVTDIPVEFTIDDMEKFDQTLTPEHLDAIMEIGFGILHADDDSDVVDECDCNGECKGGECKCNSKTSSKLIVGEDNENPTDIDVMVKKFADDVKRGEGWIVDDDDDILCHFQNNCSCDEKFIDDNRIELLDKITTVFTNMNIDFVPNSEIDENGDRIIEEDDEEEQLLNPDEEVIEESHIPFSSFIPVCTIDGEDTGWRMGPSDFSGRKRSPMRCSLDPSYTIAKDETIMINPKFPEQRIALTSYYKAEDGDVDLIDTLDTKFGLQTNLKLD